MADFAGKLGPNVTMIDLHPRADAIDVGARIHTDALHRLFTLLSETPFLKDREREARERDRIRDLEWNRDRDWDRDARRDAGHRRFNLNLDRNRRHNAITVSGPRGSGKTTFLLTVLDAIAVDQNDAASWSKVLGIAPQSLPRLYPLQIIDPAQFENRQHIMVLVLDLIWEAVKAEKIYYSSSMGADSRRDRDRNNQFNTCEDKLRQCARGLGLLDGIGQDSFGKDWMDADFILDRGLENARAAVRFEADFSDFVEAALNALDMDAFVLAIDDIDTRFDRGWPVLEAIRKYMVSPHLRVILSGDLNLYSLLVRRQQWEQMGKDLLAPEQWLHEKMPGQRQSLLPQMAIMVDQLQEQYLTKVLPGENRISLHTLDEYVRRGKVFGLRIPDGEVIPLMRGLELYARDVLGLRIGFDLRGFATAFLGLGLRNSIQILRASGIGSSGVKVPEAALSGLVHVAWPALQMVGLRPAELQGADPRRLIAVLMRWFSQDGQWPRLSLDAPDPAMRLTLLAVGACLSDGFRRDRGAMFEYMLTIGQMRSLTEIRMPEEVADVVRRFSQNYSGETRSLIARLASRFMRPSSENSPRRGSVFGDAVDIYKIKSKYNNLNNPSYAVINLLIIRFSYGDKNPSAAISFSRIIQLISSICLPGIGGYHIDYFRKHVRNCFESMFDGAKYPYIEYDSDSTSRKNNKFRDRIILVDDELVNSIAEWCFSFICNDNNIYKNENSEKPEGIVDGVCLGEDISVPPMLFDRIWARFSYAADVIDREVGAGRKLGNVLGRYTMAFLHACGAELCSDMDGAHLSAFSQSSSSESAMLEDFLTIYDNAQFKGSYSKVFEFIRSFPIWILLMQGSYKIKNIHIKSVGKYYYVSPYIMEVFGSDRKFYNFLNKIDLEGSDEFGSEVESDQDSEVKLDKNIYGRLDLS